jgi:nucleoid DNA-binding protein
MKGMKVAMKAGAAMSASGAYGAVAESAGLKPKDVKGAVEGILSLAAEQMKKSGSFKLAGMLNLKLKVRPATKARKGVNPITKEPCVFKAKPASKTVKAIPMKKLKEMVN